MEFFPIPPRLECAETFISLRSCQGTPAGVFDRDLRSEDVLFREGTSPRAEQWSGDLRVVVPPGPISNPEVKRDIADGSVSQGRARVGRCQSLTAPWRYSSRGGFLFSCWLKTLNQEVFVYVNVYDNFCKRFFTAEAPRTRRGFVRLR